MQFYQIISNKIKEAQGACIALLGGGGKTALLHKLADDFAEHYPAVLQTSLTKTAFHPSDKPLILNSSNIDELKLTNKMNPLFIIGEKISNEKLLGISEEELCQIKQKFDITIFECDGARNKPLKVHTEYDPRVPIFATHTIIIIGADVIGTKIHDGLVHRSELFCDTWNVTPDSILNIDFIVDIVSTKKGYLSKVDDNCKIIYFVNKWDEHRSEAEELAILLHKRTAKPTFYGSIQKDLLMQEES